jgi:hypothetical protein
MTDRIVVAPGEVHKPSEQSLCHLAPVRVSVRNNQPIYECTMCNQRCSVIRDEPHTPEELDQIITDYHKRWEDLKDR